MAGPLGCTPVAVDASPVLVGSLADKHLGPAVVRTAAAHFEDVRTARAAVDRIEGSRTAVDRTAAAHIEAARIEAARIEGDKEQDTDLAKQGRTADASSLAVQELTG